jgi:hypothetical protein
MLLDIETALYNASAATDAGVARLERAIGATLVAQDSDAQAHERTSK